MLPCFPNEALHDGLANMWRKSRNRESALCLLVHEPAMSWEQRVSAKDKSHSRVTENSCLLFLSTSHWEGCMWPLQKMCRMKCQLLQQAHNFCVQGQRTLFAWIWFSVWRAVMLVPMWVRAVPGCCCLQHPCLCCSAGQKPCSAKYMPWVHS